MKWEQSNIMPTRSFLSRMRQREGAVFLGIYSFSTLCAVRYLAVFDVI
jgi:hypothetical protein